MTRTRKVIIPEGLMCEECKGKDFTGGGSGWVTNPKDEKPHRIKIQLFRCTTCGHVQDDSRKIILFNNRREV